MALSVLITALGLIVIEGTNGEIGTNSLGNGYNYDRPSYPLEPPIYRPPPIFKPQPTYQPQTSYRPRPHPCPELIPYFGGYHYDKPREELTEPPPTTIKATTEAIMFPPASARYSI